MHQTIVAALSANPILTLFVVIGLGYLAGEVSLLGFKFGVAGVYPAAMIAKIVKHPPQAVDVSSKHVLG